MFSLQLSPLLSVPEDTNLNMIVQMCIKIYVALEDISLSPVFIWPQDVDVQSVILIFCDEIVSNKWLEAADGTQEAVNDLESL